MENAGEGGVDVALGGWVLLQATVLGVAEVGGRHRDHAIAVVTGEGYRCWLLVVMECSRARCRFE